MLGFECILSSLKARVIYYNKRFQRRMRQNYIFDVVRDTEPIESVM